MEWFLRKKELTADHIIAKTNQIKVFKHLMNIFVGDLEPIIIHVATNNLIEHYSYIKKNLKLRIIGFIYNCQNTEPLIAKEEIKLYFPMDEQALYYLVTHPNLYHLVDGVVKHFPNSVENILSLINIAIFNREFNRIVLSKLPNLVENYDMFLGDLEMLRLVLSKGGRVTDLGYSEYINLIDLNIDRSKLKTDHTARYHADILKTIYPILIKIPLCLINMLIEYL